MDLMLVVLLALLSRQSSGFGQNQRPYGDDEVAYYVQFVSAESSTWAVCRCPGNNNARRELNRGGRLSLVDLKGIEPLTS